MEIDIDQIVKQIRKNDRRVFAKAITLVESSNNDHQELSLQLFQKLRQGKQPQSIRLGITGTPGVGKSTFIDKLGLDLVNKGLKLAVLAVDPSSQITGGSILGDKTRMSELSKHKSAYIRPLPTGPFNSGGVSRRTPEIVHLCELAGFDVVIVETTGVGQTDYQVSQMTDVFVLLISPGGGDELQGIKRGILEKVDMVLINKSDGDLQPLARQTKSEYQAALHLFRQRTSDPKGYPKVNLLSAISGTGIENSWQDIINLCNWRKDNGMWDSIRRDQDVERFQFEIKQEVLGLLTANPSIENLVSKLKNEVIQGKVLPSQAALKVSDFLKKNLT